jgi:hypothetical protein
LIADEHNQVKFYPESGDEDYADVGIYEDEDANESRPMSSKGEISGPDQVQEIQLTPTIGLNSFNGSLIKIIPEPVRQPQLTNLGPNHPVAASFGDKDFFGV